MPNEINTQNVEPLLRSDPQRFVLFPIQFPVIWKAYKDVSSYFWVAESIDLSSDLKNWPKLTNDQQHIVLIALTASMNLNTRLHEKLVNRVTAEITAPEARCYLGYLQMTSNIHTEALYNSISSLRPKKGYEGEPDSVNIPFEDEKYRWAVAWGEKSDSPLCDRLLALIAIKEIFSSSSSAVLQSIINGDIMPGLNTIYTNISRDNERHIEFLSLLLLHLQERPTEDQAKRIILDAVKLEKASVDWLHNANTDTNIESIHAYIEFLADRILLSIGYSVIYKTKNPLLFMKAVSGEQKAAKLSQLMAADQIIRTFSPLNLLDVDSDNYDF